MYSCALLLKVVLINDSISNAPHSPFCLNFSSTYTLLLSTCYIFYVHSPLLYGFYVILVFTLRRLCKMNRTTWKWISTKGQADHPRNEEGRVVVSHKPDGCGRRGSCRQCHERESNEILSASVAKGRGRLMMVIETVGCWDNVEQEGTAWTEDALEMVPSWTTPFRP